MQRQDRDPAAPLAGCTALVTGASGGIGRAVAAALARAGAGRLILVGRNEGKLRREAAGMPAGVADPLPLDLADAGAVEAAFAAGLFPDGLDVLVHAAGVHEDGPVEATGTAALDALFAVNLRAPLVVTRSCLHALRAAEGQVVFVNSSQGLSASGGVGAYAASKHGLKALADALRREVNADGVRVLSLFLGRVDTPMQARIQARRGIPYDPSRAMRPEDVAAMTLAALSLPRTAEATDISLRPMRAPADGGPPVRDLGVAERSRPGAGTGLGSNPGGRGEDAARREAVLGAVDAWLRRIDWPEPADEASAQERRRLARVPTPVLAEAFRRAGEGEPWERYLEFHGWLALLTPGPQPPIASGRRPFAGGSAGEG
jgi:NAD(P)-dependent dehydrogenase (short-subunit alcohol dehydrogenase family)